MSPSSWIDWAAWASTQCLGTFPASNDVREGCDLGLIPDVELVSRVGCSIVDLLSWVE